ncbi:5-(carboxyamino)imidazole ribonucleotide mutase [Arcanobacterium hippocoleae]
MKKIGIVMGSDSDLPVIAKAINYLNEIGAEFTVNVYSAHRTPDEAIYFARNAKNNGYGVIIAAAGMAAHLAGVLAANTVLPVIGIPCTAKALDGIDALLSTVMMPPGIPVAAVGIDGAKNAAILACQILAVTDSELAEKLLTQREANTAAILEKIKNNSRIFFGAIGKHTFSWELSACQVKVPIKPQKENLRRQKVQLPRFFSEALILALSYFQQPKIFHQARPAHRCN